MLLPVISDHMSFTPTISERPRIVARSSIDTRALIRCAISAAKCTQALHQLTNSAWMEDVQVTSNLCLEVRVGLCKLCEFEAV
jgi:hypothetical protein